MIQALWHGVWADNTLPGKLIVLVILGLLAGAVRAARRHLRRYGRERTDLAQLATRLRESAAPTPVPPEDGAPVPAEARPEPRHVSPADLAALRRDLAPESLIAERLEAIEKLRTRQVRVNPNALQELSRARDEARPGMAVPGAVAGLATMLGLLGTFIGLAIMVQEIQFVLPTGSDAVTYDSWSQSVENLSRVLGGIKTAFSTSLVGMVCSLLASLLAFRLRLVQARFFERLERFTTEELLPAAVPAVEDESLLDRVSLQLENSFSRLDDLYRQNQEALKDMTGAQRAFLDIVEEIRKITRSEASRNLEGVLEQVAQANRSVLAVADQLPKIVHAVEAGQRRLIDRLASALSALPSGFPSQAAKPQVPWIAVVLFLAILAAAVYLLRA
jgi:biopolymer transport protein ExbB/TolQ